MCPKSLLTDGEGNIGIMLHLTLSQYALEGKKLFQTKGVSGQWILKDFSLDNNYTYLLFSHLENSNVWKISNF